MRLTRITRDLYIYIIRTHTHTHTHSRWANDQDSDYDDDEIRDEDIVEAMDERHTSFFSAVTKGDLSTVEAMIATIKDTQGIKDAAQEVREFVNYQNEGNGRCPLMLAAETGHIGIAKLLLEQGADVNLVTIHERVTPFLLACRNFHNYSPFPAGSNPFAMMDLLLSMGANLNAQSRAGYTAAHLAGENVSSSLPPFVLPPPPTHPSSLSLSLSLSLTHIHMLTQ